MISHFEAKNGCNAQRKFDKTATLLLSERKRRAGYTSWWTRCYPSASLTLL